jgi:colicin import membrane protein
MSAATVPPFRRIHRQHKMLPAFVLALGMHALLVFWLWFEVRWKTQDPAPVVAELWVAAPQPVVEVPTPPPPPPPPKVEPKPEPPKPDADIVTKEEKKPPPKVEPPKVEEKKPPPPPPKKEEPKKDPIADLLKKQEAKQQAEREAIRQSEAARIEQQMAQDRTMLGTPAPGAGAARNADYIARLTALIKSRIVYAVPDGTPTSVYADVQVDLLPMGEVTAIKFLKPSELPEYDAAVERAIRRTDPFPRKPDGTVDRTITIRFRPVEPQG